MTLVKDRLDVNESSIELIPLLDICLIISNKFANEFALYMHVNFLTCFNFFRTYATLLLVGILMKINRDMWKKNVVL